MFMKVVAPTSLIVVLSATVANAQEGTKPNEGTKTEDGAACPPDLTEVPACPPETPTAMPPPPPPAPAAVPVSYPQPAPQPMGPQPVAFDADKPAESYLDLAPRNAFELGFQGGYAQQFGDLVQGVRISDVADAGGEVGLGLGWRVGPMGMIGINGTFNEQFVDDQFADNDDMNIRGGSVGIQGTVYMAPYSVANPYLTMGAGYRTYWIDPEGPADSTIYHGVELARLQLGLDFRMARDFSLGPVAGAGLNLMLSEDGPNQDAGADALLDEPRPSAFVTAGLGGRFEIGGTRQSKSSYYGTAAAPSTQLTAQR